MIHVEDLHFSYPGAATPTLHGLTFEIAEGEVFGFLGPSGAGKSTTQKILIGLLQDYQGQVQVLGREVGTWGPGYYEHIGVSFELPNHYLRLTARENLHYFRALYEGPTHDPLTVLQWVDLADDADKKVSDFSKGMKVRLNVARSLLHQPKVLFLDEPTSGLDPVNARKVKDLVLGLRRQGTTVFVTTHNMMVADELCDRVGFLTDGHLRVVDAPGALKKQYGRRIVRVEYRDTAGKMQQAEFPLDGLGEDAAFAGLLRTADRLETIHTQETTLENIFIEVTGEALRA